jgi:hypothetical protein
MKRLLIWGVLIGVIVIIFNEGNQTKIPLGLMAFDVWVSDLSTGEKHLAATIKSNYNDGNAGLQECRSAAAGFAAKNNIRSWNYRCCTVTNTSPCLTSLR